jgi:uncharacterized protein (TIGR02266 family)
MANSKNVSILVADDSKLWQRIVREMLVEAGYETHLASDGLECVRKLKYELDDVSLVLLDIRMPELDGFGVLKELKQARVTANIPVLAISSDYREEHIEELKRLGAAGYLSKKAPLENILFRINRILYPEKRELRMSPRVEDNILVRYRIGESDFSCYSYNISTGGLFLRTTAPPPENTPLRLVFSLPRNNHLIESEGVVTWRNEYRPDAEMSYPPGIGVKFTRIESEDKRAIKRHVLQRLT